MIISNLGVSAEDIQGEAVAREFSQWIDFSGVTSGIAGGGIEESVDTQEDTSSEASTTSSSVTFSCKPSVRESLGKEVFGSAENFARLEKLKMMGASEEIVAAALLFPVDELREKIRQMRDAGKAKKKAAKRVGVVRVKKRNVREKGTQNTLEADALAGGQLSRSGTGSAEVETTVRSEAEADSTAARNLESNHPEAASEAAFVFELSYAHAEAGTSEYVE